MVYLHWDANDFGFQGVDTVKAPYNTLEEAVAQAAHDLSIGRHPLMVVDEDDNVLWKPE